MILPNSWSLLWCLTAFARVITAQTIPSTWQEQNITSTRAECIQNAEDTLVQCVGNIWPSPRNITLSNVDLPSLAQLCIQMANYDALTGQTKFKRDLLGYISSAERVVPGFAHESTRAALGIGYAAARAYETYREGSYLDYAKEAWSFGRKFTISEEDISAGFTPGKKFTLQKTCNGASLVGGTFATNKTDDAEVDAWSTGNFLILSGFLYRLTTNETYLSAARTTLQFLLNQMQLEGNGLFASSIFVNEWDVCRMSKKPSGYENALIMQGISIFSSVRPSTEYNAIIKNLVVGATSNPDWHNKAGILSVPDLNDTPSYLPRGLVQVYNATTDTDLRKYISAYLSTQYNAIMEHAPPNNLSIGRVKSRKIAALLAATAISPSNDSEVTPVVPDPPSPSGPDPPSPIAPAPIVGGVLGGLAFIAIILVAGLWYWRCRMKNAMPTTPYLNPNDIVADDLFQIQILPRQRIYRRPNPDVKRSAKWSYASSAPPDYATLPP